MKPLMIIALAGLLTSCAGNRTDRPPGHKMIEMTFFKCEKCKSLEGGIYGKGPFKSLRSPQAKVCVHEWQRIGRDEFRHLGTEWSGIDWSSEIPFWSVQSTNGIPNKEPEATR